MAKTILDLGQNHTLRVLRWAPDRTLNPQYAHLPDVEHYGAVIAHPGPLGVCEATITFDGPVRQELSPAKPRWHVVEWEPLTVTPSVVCACGDHGWIRKGRWVPA